jgi:hypothetical protein
MRLWGFVFFCEELAETIQAEFPVSAMVFDPLFELREASGLDPAGTDAANFLGADELAVFEDLEVLADGGQCDAEGLSQSGDCDRPSAQQVQHGPARGVAESVEEAINVRLRLWHRWLDSPVGIRLRRQHAVDRGARSILAPPSLRHPASR